MLENEYIFYSDYFKNRCIKNEKIFIAKTKNSYLIGPKIDTNFDEISFYKRVKSNSIYSTKIYKKMFRKKAIFLIEKYFDTLDSNQVVEVFKDNEVLIHKIIRVPGDIYEKE